MIYNYIIASAWQLNNLASSSFAWLSVEVKQGLTTVVPRKVVKADWEDNFSQLLTIVEPGFEGKVVDKILISPNERFADPALQVEITAPLSVCDTFRCRFVRMPTNIRKRPRLS